MKKQLEKNVIKSSVIIFLLCLAVHIFEVLVIRTDETVLAECFINKVFGIILLFVILGLLKWRWKDIGFTKEKIVVNLLKGLGLCFVFLRFGICD